MPSNLSLVDKRIINKNKTLPTLNNPLKFKKYGLAIAILGGVLAVSGCATKPTYKNTGPKVQLNAQGVPNFYQVRSGDTVSQIAKRYGLNYRHIGAINRLDSRYTIYAGQWLKLWESGNSTAYQKPTYNPPSTSQPTYSQPSPSPAPKGGYSSSTTITKGFIYPTSNQVIQNFNVASGENSMWFGGKIGDPIVASQSGQVLYAGNGLPEYGNLIMIRHDETFITVYAHNDKLHVSEGAQVQKGQKIATMGNSGQVNQVALEFQVRENGTPVDPRSVLGF